MKSISMGFSQENKVYTFMSYFSLYDCYPSMLSVKFDKERGLKYKSLFQISKESIIEILRKWKGKFERKQTFLGD